MMPIFLSLLVCVLHSSACHVVVPGDAPEAGISSCQVLGMQVAAAWTKKHPGMYVAKIRCSIGNRPAPEDAA
ncbi:MAG TPA: hypothetical protein VIJ55_15325 [Acetobacteraceae bacterium]